MAVKIRATRGGRKKRPHYRIVAMDERKARDSRYLEILGVYDPLAASEGVKCELRKEAIITWLKKGAQMTQIVKDLLRKEGFVQEYVTQKESSKNAQKKKTYRKARYKPLKEKVTLKKEQEVLAKEIAKKKDIAQKKKMAQEQAKSQDKESPVEVDATTKEPPKQEDSPEKEAVSSETNVQALKPEVQDKASPQEAPIPSVHDEASQEKPETTSK